MLFSVRRLAIVIALLVTGGPLAAQRVRGSVVLADSTTPARGAILVLVDSGRPLSNFLTTDRGTFDVALPHAGDFELRALRIGYRPTVIRLDGIASGETRTIRIVLTDVAVSLQPVTVRGRTECRLRPEAGLAVSTLWDEARKALIASNLTRSEGALSSRWVTYDSLADESGRNPRSGTMVVNSGASGRPFGAAPAGYLETYGYVRHEDDGGDTYFGPDADVFLSESFARTHCFHAEPPARAHPGWVGVGFAPSRLRDGIADIEGTLWMDRSSSELQLLEYRYVGLPAAYLDARAGGTTEFVALDNGRWIVSSWTIRMPRMTRLVGDGPVGSGRMNGRLVANAVQLHGGAVLSVSRGGDLVFSAGALPEGQPGLPASTIAAPGLPTHDFVVASCGSAAPAEGRSTLSGTVLEAAERVAARADVRLTWQERVLLVRVGTAAGARSQSMEAQTTTSATGLYAFCSAPREVPLTLRATLGDRRADATVRIPKAVQDARVDLTLGAPRTPE